MTGGPPLAALAALYAGAGQRRYDGEDVLQSEHACQCAALAAAAGAPEPLVAAAFLHDVGHLLLAEPAEPAEPAGDTRHEEAGAAWLAGFLPAAVAEPVRLHVAAKRLLARDPRYVARLSAESVRTLALQGGPFDEAQARAFLAQPHAADAVALRRWDDAAKVPGRVVPGVEAWLARVALLAGAATAAG